VYEPVRDGWPTTVETSTSWLIEHGIGWDAAMMMSDGRFTVERDDGRPVGLRFALHDDWWVVVVATPDRWSIGRYRAMVPFGWLHGVDTVDLSTMTQRAAAIGYAWPPTDEEP
jgi:hypothetical protein